MSKRTGKARWRPLFDTALTSAQPLREQSSDGKARGSGCDSVRAAKEVEINSDGRAGTSSSAADYFCNDGCPGSIGDDGNSSDCRADQSDYAPSDTNSSRKDSSMARGLVDVEAECIVPSEAICRLILEPDSKCGIAALKRLLCGDSDAENGTTGKNWAKTCPHSKDCQVCETGGGDRVGIVQESPLHLASMTGKSSAIRLLLRLSLSSVRHISNRFKVKSGGGPQKMTPLILAASGGHLDAVAELLLAGAHVSQCDADGNSALHVAAKNGYESVVQELLPHVLPGHGKRAWSPSVREIRPTKAPH